MYQFFVEQNQIHMAEKRVVILGTDVNHIKNVLRMKPGEEISVSDGVERNIAVGFWRLRKNVFSASCGL